jgi:hypothetical protein
LHFCIADRKAGDCLWTPLKPPGAPGSGKFDTPCERMQFANATPLALPVPAELLGLDEDPQALIASADESASRVITSRRLKLTIDSVVADRTADAQRAHGRVRGRLSRP